MSPRESIVSVPALAEQAFSRAAGAPLVPGNSIRLLKDDGKPMTAGKGIIATETQQQIIVPGDVVHIPSEEKHWHGATHDSAFSHIALTAKGSTTTQAEK